MGSMHYWAVGLHLVPGHTEMRFTHSSSLTGHQTLDSVAWPISPDVKTERAYLAELYDGVLAFMEVRA
jgi:hypothetical protein